MTAPTKKRVAPTLAGALTGAPSAGGQVDGKNGLNFKVIKSILNPELSALEKEQAIREYENAKGEKLNSTKILRQLEKLKERAGRELQKKTDLDGCRYENVDQFLQDFMNDDDDDDDDDAKKNDNAKNNVDDENLSELQLRDKCGGTLKPPPPPVVVAPLAGPPTGPPARLQGSKDKKSANFKVMRSLLDPEVSLAGKYRALEAYELVAGPSAAQLRRQIGMVEKVIERKLQEQTDPDDGNLQDTMDRIIMDMLDNDARKKKKKKKKKKDNAKKNHVALEDLSEAQLHDHLRVIGEKRHKESSAAPPHAPGGQKEGDRVTKKKKATKEKKSYRSVRNKRKKLREEAQNKASGGDDEEVEEKSAQKKASGGDDEEKSISSLEKSGNAVGKVSGTEPPKPERPNNFGGFPENHRDELNGTCPAPVEPTVFPSLTGDRIEQRRKKKANEKTLLPSNTVSKAPLESLSEAQLAVLRDKILAGEKTVSTGLVDKEKKRVQELRVPQQMNKKAKTRTENKRDGNKNITERLAGEPPKTAKQQLCSKIREKVEELKNPMEVLHAMSTPFARTDAYDSYAEESDTESVVIQKQYPWVIHSTACFTEMKTNPDGTGPDGGRFLKKPRMVFWVASKKAASKLKEEIEKGKIDLEFTTSYADYDNALRSKSAK